MGEQRLDIVEAGMLKRLSQGALWEDRVTHDQRQTLIRLCAGGLAESQNAHSPHQFKPSGMFFRITDAGRAVLN